ncbi:MAG: alkaline phosphatase family protein [Actinomycetota bacterium]
MKSVLILAAAATVTFGGIVGVDARPHNRAPRPIVIIFMENHSATSIIGNPSAPYENAFAAQGIRFTNYQEPPGGGPSLPDYLQLVAGSGCGKTSDSVIPGDPSISAAGCTTTLWNQLEAAGISWAVYEEGMPGACASNVTYDDRATGGPYALKHNPATPFPAIWSHRELCQAHVLPFSVFDPSALPAVSFVAPNICNDQHGSSDHRWSSCMAGSSALLARGDAWLAAHVPAMRAAGATIFLTYDESGTLFAAEVGHHIRPGLDATPMSHYSVLAGIEKLYHLPLLLNAATANPISFSRGGRDQATA